MNIDLIRVIPRVDLSVIRETLTRIGIADKKRKILYPSCNLIELNDNYYICHFKNMFILTKENGYDNMSEEDICRRNSIIYCLQNWNLIDVDITCDIEPHDIYVYVLPFKEKNNWTIIQKFNNKG